ncbi:MAG TPA: hypothetical protein VGR33_02490 [Actinomycetota bacterium]|nr:hypothetical protein [Actinomycetota bacterium]
MSVLFLALVITQGMGMIAAYAQGSPSTSGSHGNTESGGRNAGSTGDASVPDEAADPPETASTGPPGASSSPSTGANISSDLVAAGPFTYNHTTLAGTGPNLPWYDSRTISGNAGVVESLEGGDFRCGDLVLFFVKVEVTGGSGSRDVALDISFLKEPTGQPGVGFDDIVGASLSTNDSGGGGGNANLEGDEAISLSNERDGTVGGKDALLGTVTITNLNPGDVLVAAIWAHLGCEAGTSPTGNLQTALMDVSSTNNDDNFSNAGRQTIPFKKIEAIPQPALNIVKTADADTVQAGNSIGFTIHVENEGNVPLANITLSDPLPTGPGISWSIAGSPTGSDTAGLVCEIAGHTLTCTKPSLAVNGDFIVHVTSPTTDNSCGQYDNTATITSGQLSDRSSDSVTVRGCNVNLAITKDADPTTVSHGGAVTFTIVASNTSNSTATGVHVTDSVPAGLTITGIPSFTGGSNGSGTCSVTGQNVDCNIGSLGAGASATVTIHVTATEAACPSVRNTATVSATNETGSSEDNTGSVTVNVNCGPNLTITKEGPASVGEGATFTYTISVKNAGNAQATGVIVADDLADSLTGVSASFDVDPGLAGGTGSCTVGAGNTISCAVGNLAADDGAANGPDQVVVTINATAPNTCGQLSNTATVDSDQTSPQTSNAVITTITGCVPPPPPPPPPSPPTAGIQVVKGGPTVAHVGDTITYTFAVSLAAGSATLTNITLVDPICNATPTLVSKTGGDQDTALETGESWTYTCTHVVTATDPDPLPNTVTVTGMGPGGQVSDTDFHSVDIVHPDIRIVKTANPDSIGPGETVTYTFKVTNTGDVTLFDVKVTDDKLGNICTIGRLEVGETQTCTADFTASSDFGGPLVNVGKAKGHDVTGISVQDTDRVSIDVVLGKTVTPPVTPPSGLAFTGPSGLVQMAGVALLLLLLGTGILFFTRRHEDGMET